MGKVLLEDVDLLRNVLDYSPETGTFNWKIPVGTKVKAGQKAGYIQNKSKTSKYILIRFMGENYLAHQLAWFYYYGYLPKGILDHEDGDGCNNSITNLRDVNNLINSKNQRMGSRNTSGFVGVSYHTKNKNWVATICVEGKTVFLGAFGEKQDAINARIAANIYYEFHLNHGKNRS